jgi:hypothetical protein
VVEFSNQDLKCPDATGRANSVTSDQSFDMAVRATRLQRERAANNKTIQEQVYTNFRWFDKIQEVHKFNSGVRILRMVFIPIPSTQKPVHDKIMVCENFFISEMLCLLSVNLYIFSKNQIPNATITVFY